MKKILLSFALIVGLLTSASTAMAQVNMSRYITLTVTNGAAIKLNFMAAAAGTPVRIVSGSNTQNITVGNSWYNNNVPSTYTVTARASTMTVYGDLTGFNCGYNAATLTALDLSNNTQLEILYCWHNELSSLNVSGCTQLTKLECHDNTLTSLDVSGCTQLKELECYYNTLTSLDVSGCTQLTKLRCYDNTLTSLDVSGCTQLKELRCYDNTLTSLDVSGCTQLEELRCYDNTLTSLDVSGCTQLKELRCYDNTLTSLDVSGCTQLMGLECYSNTLTSLDVSGCTQLEELRCYDNTLTSLDVSHNTQLTSLDCSNNRLSNLDISHNTQLWGVYCHGNNFSTQALDDIYCALPDRTSETNGVIQPVFNSSSSNLAIVLATNKANAIAKNWKVQYYNDDTDIPATAGSYVCPQLNMSRYITLIVANGAAIKLDFKAAFDGTPVKIVSGSNTQDITVGTGWKGTATYTAGSTTMTVYGDLIGFDCSQNGANLTALDPSHNTQLTGLYCSYNNLTTLDVSHNTQLTVLNCSNNNLSSLDVSKNTQLTALYCYGNNFSTLDLDRIYCALPDRTGNTNGVIEPVYNSSSSNHATVLATNKANAIAKNWKVQYYQNDTDIPATTGSYVCPQLNMSRYITLTVTNGAAIKLDFKAAAEDTPVRIVSGSNIQNITVGTSWIGFANYTAGSTTMTVYGDLTDFNCQYNRAKLTALDPSHNTLLTGLYCNHNNLSSLDVSHNTQLTSLDCGSNTLSSLDVSKNTQLIGLSCFSNNLSSLDVSHNTQLTGLYCYSNTLSSLDLSKNTELTGLYCYSNTLSSLDVSKNTQLTSLDCSNNNLSSLDISKNTKLLGLYCSTNKFTTAALDDIFCALPVRQASDNARIQPVYSDTSSNHAIVLATNKANAIAKNWKVQYYKNDADIPATTGSYVCGSAEPNMSRYITLTVANGAAIKLDFKAAAAATPVRIVSGSNTQNITVGTNWTGITSYTAAASTMTIYGNLIGFDCSKNGVNLTALDPSHNTQLTSLYCSSNTLSSLDVSKNTQLTRLYCFSNTLSSLDVSHNTQLTELHCYRNQLASLDVSNNTQLTELYCHGNNFTTAALDDIFCALPDRTGKESGAIQPVYSDTSSNHAIVLATNKANAIAKNWKVQYYADDTDIPATTGSYVCSGGGSVTTYHLWIAGVQVTSANCSDLSVIDSVSGTVKYDPTNKVLTLENATIQINTTNAIVSNIDGLTIKVIGTNNLTTGSSPTLSFIKPLTITGGGVLNAKSEGDCAIYSSGTNHLTIDGCTVNAKGRYGIAGFDGSSEMLTIKNSTVTAEGTDGSIIAFASLILDGCAITQPAGAAFDASLHAVALGGAEVTSKVVISPTGGEPNMNSYITLTVTNGAAIRLDFKAVADGTPIRIVSGSNTQDITVGTDWKGTASYTADDINMTVYGDITNFDCSNNKENLTAIDVSNNTQLTELSCEENTLSSLDVSKNTQLTILSCRDNKLNSLDISHNTQLTELWCEDNNLSSLDVSKNTQLTSLDCRDNKLNSLDISHNTQLTELYCRDNKLSSLDVSHNTQLTELYCESNNLSSLDVSKNTQLTRLDCFNNRLSNLDISHNTQLTELYCHGNNFTTAALDDIFCALPDRIGKENGLIEPVYSDTSSNHAIVLATNKANAIAKNWKVQYYADDTDIPATTGTYECGTPHTDIAEAAAEPALTLYPNPVADVLYLSATARTIRIYDMYGTEVAHATDTDRVDVAHLPAGTYTVRADGTVAKMVKR